MEEKNEKEGREKENEVSTSKPKNLVTEVLMNNEREIGSVSGGYFSPIMTSLISSFLT